MAATIAANLLGDRNILSAIVFAVCNAFEAVLVAGLIERYFGLPFRLDSPTARARIGCGGDPWMRRLGDRRCCRLFVVPPVDCIRSDNLVPLVRIRRDWHRHGCSVRDRSRRHGARPPSLRETVEGAVALTTLAIASLASDRSCIALHGTTSLSSRSFRYCYGLPRAAGRFLSRQPCSLLRIAIVWMTTFEIGLFGDRSISIGRSHSDRSSGHPCILALRISSWGTLCRTA